MSVKDQYRATAERYGRIFAEQYKLPPTLIAAIISVESSGDTCAWNPEPFYKWLWDVRTNKPFRKLSTEESSRKTAPSDFPFLAGDRDQEWWGQQASWGLMQIMGAVARERGLNAPYLTILLDLEFGIDYGCRQLAWLKERHFARHGWDGVIVAYNTGRPTLSSAGQAYLNKVKKAGWEGGE